MKHIRFLISYLAGAILSRAWTFFFTILITLPIALIATISFAQTQSGTKPTAKITFTARLTADSPAIENGVQWRVFSGAIDATGQLKLLAEANGGERSFNMSAGQYMVHAAYGHASAVRKIEVGNQASSEVFIFNAGGLELSAVAGTDTPIFANSLRFDIYEAKQNEQGNRRLIAQKIRPDQIVPFSTGTYHVISYFGNLNAVVRADLKVEPGQITKAQLKHRAARITLRLVRSAGGDALADTKWSVLTESGELITESTSAFPRIVLLEGVYTAIAKNGDRIYSQDFTVKAGINQDVEVVTVN